MTTYLEDPVRPTGVTRGRGGFLRKDGGDGPPLIARANGDTHKDGTPKREIYGSPSNFGKLIENATALQKWNERRVVLGLGVTAAAGDYSLLTDAHHLARLDDESDEFKDAADAVIVRAKDAAKASLAADRGTHTHTLTEDDDEGRDIVARLEAGVDLGIDPEVQQALVQAWRDMLARTGLEIVAVESSVVDDRWRLAGTLDRLARTTRPLRFVKPGGEVVEIPAGVVIVLDLKTGKRRTNASGVISFWHGYSVQVASYAQSAPYDTEAETRGDWPFTVSQDHAVIAHLDVAAALAGEPATCELVYVDLPLAREHGGEVVLLAKAWGKRNDLFSVAMLDEEGAVKGPETKEDAGGCANGCNAPFGIRCSVCNTDKRAAKRADDIAPPEFVKWNVEAFINVNTSADDAEPPSAPAGEEQATPGLGAPVEAPGTGGLLAPGADLAPHDQLAQVPTDPDEGGPGDPEAFAILERQYKALPAEARAWVSALGRQAQHALVPFHTNGSQTVRRFEIVRGVTHIAHLASDDTLRAVLATIIGDVALFPAVTPGHALGSLGADEAATFARRCEALVSTTVPAHVDDSGVLRLAFDDAA